MANAGPGPAGPFIVSVNYAGTFSFPSGLAAGASITQPAHQTCFGGTTYTATADSAGQVSESDETNNAMSFQAFC